MAAPIDDVTELPGRKVRDQELQPIGEVKEIYAIGGDGDPMYVSVEASFGLADKRIVVIPLARIKEEDGELAVPYSKEHIKQTPEVDTDEISSEDDRRLRDHFGIDRGDQELRSDNLSYATLVTDQDGTAQRVEDPKSIDTPDADTRDEDTKKRLHDVGPAETRDVDAGEIADSLTGGGKESGQGDEG